MPLKEKPMALEFYWFSGSCNSWRVHLALELKKVPYESHLLQFSKKEHKTADYLAINPRGKVPAVRDGSFTLTESLAILLYLDRRFPEPAVFGKTAEEGGQILRRALDLIFYFEPIVDRIAVPIYRAQVDPEPVKTAAQEAHRELSLLDTALTAAPFLAGQSVSAADFTAFPFVQQLLRASGKEVARPLELGFLPLEAQHPALAAWVKRIEALPGYERTYPPHWR
jgi:glutathione S-transferase